jgi:hypothetical protein
MKLLGWALVILLGPVTVMCILFMAVAPFYLIWQHFNPPAMISLSVGQWECSAEFQELVFNGKYWTTVTRCSQYSRRQSQ